MGMTKTQLVKEMQERLLECDDNWKKQDVLDALNVLEEVVTDACCDPDYGSVNLTGFVKFARVDRPARMGRNPATGETIKIKAKTVAKATALKRFKDAVLNS